jgi:tRNA pseudouridine38-40 synthase
VHASAQVVGFATDVELDGQLVVRSLNRQLAPHIAVTSLAMLSAPFSARFDATWRSYDYLIVDGGPPDPFTAHFSWQIDHDLDEAAMNSAAGAFLGEHDFASLCRKADGRSSVRRVAEAEWTRTAPSRLRYHVAAGSFCHQMVRSMVAICVDVGRGKVAPADVAGMLSARDRGAARGVAPPHGLTLVGVGYAEEHGGPLVAALRW